MAAQPLNVGLFNFSAHIGIGRPGLGDALRRVLDFMQITDPDGFFYGSHRHKIEGFNELVNVQLLRAWLMQLMDWYSESMFQVYFYRRILTTSTWTGFWRTSEMSVSASPVKIWTFAVYKISVYG